MAAKAAVAKAPATKLVSKDEVEAPAVPEASSKEQADVAAMFAALGGRSAPRSPVLGKAEDRLFELGEPAEEVAQEEGAADEVVGEVEEEVEESPSASEDSEEEESAEGAEGAEDATADDLLADALEREKALTEQVNALAEQVLVLRGGGGEGAKAITPLPTAEVPASAPPPSTSTSVAMDLSEEAFEKIVTNPKEFAAYVSGVASKAAATARAAVLLEVGNVVNANLQVRSTMASFFGRSENQDLQPVIKFVQAEAASVESEHPDYSIEQVLQAAAERTRTKLRSTARAAKRGKAQTPSRQFARGTGARVAQKKQASQVPTEFEAIANSEFAKRFGG